MSRVLELAGRIQALEKTLNRLEAAARQDLRDEAVTVNLQQLLKRRDDLEDEFLEAAAEEWVDVCSYRLFKEDGGRPNLTGLTNALRDFQQVYTYVYDALTKGPRKKGAPGSESVDATEFEFAYSFPGSVGVVLTIPNQRALFDESNLDRAMETVFELASADDSEQIAKLAERLGPAPIRKLYTWTTDHLTAGVGVDIEWMRKDVVRASVLVQVPELENLKQVIDETSDRKSDMIEITGELQGANIRTHGFELLADSGESIRGKMAEALGVARPVELSKRYKATIARTRWINFATEDEGVEYYLHDLSETNAPAPPQSSKRGRKATREEAAQPMIDLFSE